MPGFVTVGHAVAVCVPAIGVGAEEKLVARGEAVAVHIVIKTHGNVASGIDGGEPHGADAGAVNIVDGGARGGGIGEFAKLSGFVAGAQGEVIESAGDRKLYRGLLRSSIWRGHDGEPEAIGIRPVGFVEDFALGITQGIGKRCAIGAIISGRSPCQIHVPVALAGAGREIVNGGGRVLFGRGTSHEHIGAHVRHQSRNSTSFDGLIGWRFGPSRSVPPVKRDRGFIQSGQVFTAVNQPERRATSIRREGSRRRNVQAHGGPDLIGMRQSGGGQDGALHLIHQQSGGIHSQPIHKCQQRPSIARIVLIRPAGRYQVQRIGIQRVECAAFLKIDFYFHQS